MRSRRQPGFSAENGQSCCSPVAGGGVAVTVPPVGGARGHVAEVLCRVRWPAPRLPRAYRRPGSAGRGHRSLRPPAPAASAPRGRGRSRPSTRCPNTRGPQLERARWLSLNGQWQYGQGQPGQAPPFGQDLPQTILVPFRSSRRSPASGARTSWGWYRRTLRDPGQLERRARHPELRRRRLAGLGLRERPAGGNAHRRLRGLLARHHAVPAAGRRQTSSWSASMTRSAGPGSPWASRSPGRPTGSTTRASSGIWQTRLARARRRATTSPRSIWCPILHAPPDRGGLDLSAGPGTLDRAGARGPPSRGQRHRLGQPPGQSADPASPTSGPPAIPTSTGCACAW